MEKLMRAAVYDGTNLNLTDKPLRAVAADEVLLKIAVCGVCGTDIKIVAGQSYVTPPVVLGHEYCGYVIETGTQVTSLEPGDFVAIDPNISCGQCQYCRRGQVNLCENLQALGVDIDGGFAEYCIAPAKQCFRLPENTDPVQAALLEPLSCAIYGFQKAAIKPGDSVLIFGGGLIGILMLKLARLSPARQIIVVEPDAQRRKICLKLGADLAFSADEKSESEIFKITQGGAEVVIECAGVLPAVEQALRLVKNGGRVVIFGVSPSEQKLPVAPYEIYRRDISITGSFLNPFTFKTAVDLFSAGRIDFDDIEINSFRLSGIMDAFENQRQHKSLKTVIDLR
ncbi:MAG: zinc-dependent alcohol dehydrogenase family protein [Candidatus Marinimicrobia bacterium]|nr:zinc-dependent alcohol dehydrogenase family protein [Candidatus Neomarinimicrobiota bacterium]